MIVQECGVGLVTIRRDGDRLAFAAPPLLRGGEPSEAEIAQVAELLRIDRDAIVDAAWADNGPGWIAVMLDSAEAVLAVEPARHHPEHIDIGIVGAHPPGGETAFEVRAIFSNAQGGLIEDPVTGSLNASIGQWLFASGRATGAYTAAQGTRLGRKGRIHVEQDAAGQVWVGGATRTLFRTERGLMQVAIVTFDGFNELDSFVAAGILNRLRPEGWAAYITSPTEEVTSMNGVTVRRQRPIAFAGEADAVPIGSGIRTREIAADAGLLTQLPLDPARQLIGAQCSGTLLLAKLGLIGAVPACTDLTTRPWVIEAGVDVVSAP